MAELSIGMPMTQRAFYAPAARAQNKAKMAQIADRYRKELSEAQRLTNVPLALALSVIFAESAGQPSVVSPAGAVGLMQLKPQTANDVIHLEHRAGRLTPPEATFLRSKLGNRLDGPLKQKYLSHRIKENGFTGNAIAKTDLLDPALNILLGCMYLGILLDQHREGGTLRIDKVILRYNQGYFFKIPQGGIEKALDFAKAKSREAYAYALKVIGKNGLLEVQAT